jgi:hypothetical protein
VAISINQPLQHTQQHGGFKFSGREFSVIKVFIFKNLLSADKKPALVQILKGEAFFSLHS